MNTRTGWMTGMLASLALAGAAHAAQGIELSPYTFEPRSGEKIAAEKGTFEVPENRSKRDSRRIKLSFVRFASTSPNKGAPIVYLAGGPGGSGVDAARGRRFPLFMALREVADVIALDQRGTGWSNDIPPCEVPDNAPADGPITRELAIRSTRESARHCAVFWREHGVDLAGYNTNESAADVEELRRQLGVPKVSLWAISYGTHLALATLKRYPDSIDKAVMTGIEGLDETVKLPAGTDAFFGRLQKAIDADPTVAKIYPDIAATMRRVHARLDKSPVTVNAPDVGGKPHSVTFGTFELQLIVSGSIADPARSATLPALYAQMDAGEFTMAGAIIYRALRSGTTTRMDGMSEAMDSASGISPSRARLVARQAKTSLLGDVLNWPMPQIGDALGVPDLGESFRRPVRSDVPTLFLSGTLDGRTYPESSAEVASHFSRATRVIVENGGHNLYEADPSIGGLVVRFMKGEPITTTTLHLPPPRFPH